MIVAILTSDLQAIAYGRFRRMLRYLRIVFSAFCGLACVLLIALWVRSYYWVDAVTVPISSNRAIAIGTSGGTLVVAVTYATAALSFDHVPFETWRQYARDQNLFFSPIWGGLARNPLGITIFLPDWLLFCFILAVCVFNW